MSWKNRIIGQGVEDPESLLANPQNWRIHPKHQQDALEAVLNEVGFVQNVIVNQRTGHVVDGHLRVSLALRREEKEIPVVYIDVSENEEALILATIDPLSALAATDAAKLDELLREVNTGSTLLQQMLTDLAAKHNLKYDPDNPDEHWQGMPDYGQSDQMPMRQLIVSFNSEQDVQEFAKLVEQDITPKTRSIWFPKSKKAQTVEQFVN